MSDNEAPKWKAYDYRGNSSVVLQPAHRARTDEPTGEPESLRGRELPKFGDLAERTKPKIDKEKLAKHRQKREQKKKKKKLLQHDSILEAAGNIDPSMYRPRTEETQAVYEQILNFLSPILGDYPQDVIRSAADEALAVLKDDRLSDPERQQEISSILNAPLDTAQFSKLIALGKGITDYFEDQEQDEAVLDDEVGVGVVFPEEEEAGSASDMEDVVAEGEESDFEEADEREDKSAMGSLTIQNGEETVEDEDEDRIDPRDIDAYWLNRQLATFYQDPDQCQAIADDVFSILSQKGPSVENQLVMKLGFEKEKFDFVKVLMKNKDKIVYCTRLRRAEDEAQRQAIRDEMKSSPELRSILEYLEAPAISKEQRMEKELRMASARKRKRESKGDEDEAMPSSRTLLDLDAMAFEQGSHTMSNRQCRLPEGSVRSAFKGYEEVHIPAPKPHDNLNQGKVAISQLPRWARPVFVDAGVKELNPVQSRMYEAAMNSNENVLLCAPTGAGKTNVAVLTILHEIGKCLREDGSIDRDQFKVVYIAPMKALVQEMVMNFSKRFQSYGLKVHELSGDIQMTKQQMAETQIIVTTPEKWDIVTRKTGDRTILQSVKLVIIDEIHLLHDDRGPVLESIIARTLRHIETTHEMIRIVGLSATLPNYLDVAAILRIDPPEKAKQWFFDSTFRPVPLEQQYIGVTERKALKRLQLMNEITYEKVLQMKGKPTLVFVHSRKETAKTAKMIRDTALERDTLSQLVPEEAGHRSKLQKAVEHAKHRDLKDLLPYGIAIHHAGLAREDRQLVEALFENHVVRILVSTSTLAWGVNLPAHAVIIKGTQFYNPERGSWMELSPMDVMQMVGRAGRPQYDRLGRGIMITSHNELQYYLSLLNQQLPVESQMVSRIADALNAEVVLGTVSSVEDAVDWLGYTYLYVRMLRNPTLYQVPASALQDDRALVNFRGDLVHSAATVLDKANLIKYDRKTGSFQVTDLGRVASHYYISAHSMMTYNEHLKPKMSDVELFRLFSLSSEFRYMTVRQEEKLEMQKLLNRVPIPVKENMEEPSAKVNVLFQAYISRLRLDGFALIADMVYVTQSAGRLMRALFEIVLKRGWAQLAAKMLSLCKMVDKRMWSSQSPLRQFPKLPLLVIRRIEGKELTWDRFYHLTPDQIGEHLRYPQMGRRVYNLIHQVPRLTVSAHDVRTITRSLIRVELTLTPDFRYLPEVHGASEPFWIIVEDGDSEHILHHELFLLKAAYARTNEPHIVEFTVPLRDPMDPVYFVRIVSDRWIGSETSLPLSFRHLMLPERYPPHTELLDLQPKPVSEVHESFQSLYSHLQHFNPIQTQVFSTLYHTNENVFVGAPAGSGKTYCAELALLHMFEHGGENARAVYIGPTDPIAQQRFRDWSVRLAQVNKRVVLLTGTLVTDLALVRQADVVVTTPDNWDRITRRWKSYKFVRELSLFIVDEAHLIAGETGPTLEVITSRTRFISQLAQAGKPSSTRIVAFSVPISNARDLASWMGVSPNNTFNFHPNVRPVPLEIVLQSFPQYDHSARMLAMAKPAYRCLKPGRSTIVFAPSRRRARLVAVDLATYAAAEEDSERLLQVPAEDIAPLIAKLSDPALRECVGHGIVYYHAGLPESERAVVSRLYESGAVSVMVTDYTECWGFGKTAQCVVVYGTQHYDSTIHNYTDYRIPDMLQMMGCASRPVGDESGRCVIMCPVAKKAFYKKFLHEAFPVESHLHHFLEDHMNAEIVSGVVDSKQAAVHYLAWTFLYRRLPKNPSYYNLHGTTPAHLADYLSELVEIVLQNLENSGCIQTSDDDVSPVNLGFIAAFHRISYATAEIFHSSLTKSTKLRMLIEILCAAVEFETLPVRPREDEALERLARHLPLPIPKQRSLDMPRYTDPHNKANVLLQTHFSRTRLRSEMEEDKRTVLEQSVRLLHAIVDVVSSNNWLRPALATMELCQMVVQAMWEKDSQLRQLPHVNEEAIDRCRRAGITTIFDLIDNEDQMSELLGLNETKFRDLVQAFNRYPDIDISGWTVEDKDSLTTSDPVMLSVTLSRNPDQSVTPVHAPFFPGEKLEEWWLVVGDTRNNELYANKRVTLGRGDTTVKLNVALPKAGDYNLQLFLMSDSYIGCDQEIDDIKISVAKGDSDDEYESDEDVTPMDTS